MCTQICCCPLAVCSCNSEAHIATPVRLPLCTPNARLAIAVADAQGKPIESPNKYQIMFKTGELPPAGAFWSITMYDAGGVASPNSLGAPAPPQKHRPVSGLQGAPVQPGISVAAAVEGAAH